MANNKQWPQEQLDKLVKLYLEGMNLEELADAVGKSYCATKGMLTALRKRGVHLPHCDQKISQAKRRETLASGEKKLTEFDIAYHGRVPCGHWMITKPWRKVS